MREFDYKNNLHRCSLFLPDCDRAKKKDYESYTFSVSVGMYVCEICCYHS